MERKTKKQKTDGNRVQKSEEVKFKENSTGNTVQGSDVVTLVKSNKNVVQGSDDIKLVDCKKCVIQGSDNIRLFNCENIKMQGCDDMEIKNVKNRKFRGMTGLKYDEKNTTIEDIKEKKTEYVPYTNSHMTVTGSKVVYTFPGFTIDCNTQVSHFTESQITLSNGFRITIEKKLSK